MITILRNPRFNETSIIIIGYPIRVISVSINDINNDLNIKYFFRLDTFLSKVIHKMKFYLENEMIYFS
jgi:hypothetical protein